MREFISVEVNSESLFPLGSNGNCELPEKNKGSGGDKLKMMIATSTEQRTPSS